jgi:branched-chain amino acid transport system substrate-binding protein
MDSTGKNSKGGVVNNPRREGFLIRVLVSLLCVTFILLLCVDGFAQEKKPILFGSSISQTGHFARSARGQLRSFTLASEQINNSGGLLGRRIKLIIYDDQSKGPIAVKLYRKLIYEDKVDFLLSPFGSGPTTAVTPIIEQAKIPCVAPQAGDPRIWEVKRNWVVQILASMAEYLREGIDVAVNELDAKSFAFIYADSAMQVSSVKESTKYIKENYPGIKIVLDERFPFGLEDYTPLMAKAKAVKADAMFGGGYLPHSMELVKAAKSVRYRPKAMEVFFGPDPLFSKGLKDVAEGVMTPSGWEAGVPTPGSDEFAKAYGERWKEEPYYDMAACYAAFQLMVDAIKNAGSLNRKAVRDYLFSTKTTTVYGKYVVNENGGQIGKKMLTVQWQNGKKKILMPKRLRTANPVPLWGGK